MTSMMRRFRRLENIEDALCRTCIVFLHAAEIGVLTGCAGGILFAVGELCESAQADTLIAIGLKLQWAWALVLGGLVVGAALYGISCLVHDMKWRAYEYD